MRRCRFCRAEIPVTKDCADQFQRAGFCGKDHYIEHQTAKGLAAVKRKKAAKAKEHRQDIKRRKKNLKTKSDHAREAQQVVNLYVRIRDRGVPCVSCGKPDDGTHQRHASHYRSVGACSALRYNLKNIYASCQQCNTAKSGNLIEYRIRLVERFGGGLVDWLESQNEPKRYTIEYLERIKRVFRKRVRLLKNRYNID